MNKKVLALLGVCALVAANAYAQRPFKMAKVTEAMTGGVPSAFSSNVHVNVLNAEMIGNQVRRAQFAATPKMYLSSAQLFQRVEASAGLKGLEPTDVRLLAVKFKDLDEIVRLQTADFWGYRGALWGAKPASRAEVLAHPQVEGMLNVLEIQRYMQQHHNEFPQLFTVAPGGWLLITDLWTNREGNAALQQVLDILIKEQAGQVNPEVVAQLVALYTGASNPVPVQAVVEQLKNWRIANNAPTQVPQLPRDLGAASSLGGSNAENLWLSMQIRLLQLAPGMEPPQVLKNAKVIR